MPIYRQDLLTKKRSYGVQLAEFSVMPVILLILAIPLINLFGFGMSYGLLAYTSFACVNKAAISPNFDSALAGMEGQSAAMFNGPFGTFFKLTPTGGFNASGCDLYIVTTDIDTQVSKVTGPNKALNNPPDESKNNCQYEVDAKADIAPLIPLNGIAFLSNIPVISAAASMHCSWAKSAEIPAGLALAKAAGDTRGGVPTVSLNVDGIEQINSLTRFTGQNWKNPLLYDEIKNGGVAFLIFADDATGQGRFEDYARLMFPHYSAHPVPAYIIGPELGSGPANYRAEIMKVWPERAPIETLTPEQFKPRIDKLVFGHCR